MNKDKSYLFTYFLDLSVTLTDFSKFYLQGTGQAFLYFETVEKIIGQSLFQELLETFHELDLEAQHENDQSILMKNIRSNILGSEKFGPIARNIIKMWYVATWYQLPRTWRETFGTNENDQTFVISPEAYPEGLLWYTIGVNPPGAKAPGYGTWNEPPAVTLDSVG